jgi:hypothetical protein
MRNAGSEEGSLQMPVSAPQTDAEVLWKGWMASWQKSRVPGINLDRTGAFWNEVDDVMPGYLERKERLRVRGRSWICDLRAEVADVQRSLAALPAAGFAFTGHRAEPLCFVRKGFQPKGSIARVADWWMAGGEGGMA